MTKEEEDWPEDYLDLEEVYCKVELSRFYNCTTNESQQFARYTILNKRTKFKKLWNITHKEQIPW